MINGKRQVESNVTRISRAIKPETKDGIQQIVYYHKGVASQGGVIDRTVMGKCFYLYCIRGGVNVTILYPPFQDRPG